MVDQLTLQTIGILLTGVSVSIAAVYYTLTLRNTNQTRQAQLFMQIYSRFDDSDWLINWAHVVRQWEWTDYEDWYSKYSPEMNIEAARQYSSVAAYFEGIGVLVYKNMIDVDIVADLISRWITIFWEKMGPIIKERRIRYDNEYVWEWNEWLYNKIKNQQPSRKPVYLLNE
jgi:hypothetical protein